jgi:hypothetical protein
MTGLAAPVVVLTLLASAGAALLLLVGSAEDIHAPGKTPEGGGSVGAAPGVAAAARGARERFGLRVVRRDANPESQKSHGKRQSI